MATPTEPNNRPDIDATANPNENSSELTNPQANFLREYQPYGHSTYLELLGNHKNLMQQNNHLTEQLNSAEASLKILQAKDITEKSQQSYYEQLYKVKEEEVRGKLLFLNQIIHKESENLNENMTTQMGKYYIVQRAMKILQETQSKFLNTKTELEATIESYKVKVKDLEEEISGAHITHNVVVEKLRKKLNEAESNFQTDALTSQLETCSNDKKRLLSKNQNYVHRIVYLERANKNLKEEVKALEFKNQVSERKIESLEDDKQKQIIQSHLDFQTLSKKMQPMASQATGYLFDNEKLGRQLDENQKLKSNVNSLKERCYELIISERKLSQEVKQCKFTIETLEKKLEKNLIEKHDKSTQAGATEAELDTQLQTVEVESVTVDVEPVTVESIVNNIYNMLDDDEIGGKKVPEKAAVVTKKNARKLKSRKQHHAVSKRLRLEDRAPSLGLLEC